MSDKTIPDDVVDAARASIRLWLLSHYVGGGRQLVKWNDHYESLISIYSWSLPGDDTRKNLARLKKLTSAGAIVLRHKGSNVYSFTLPRPALDQLAAEETARYERMGYVVGQIMPEIEVAA